MEDRPQNRSSQYAGGPPPADDNPWPSDGDDGEPPPDFDDPAYHQAIPASMPADPVEAAVARMNERYMVVNEAGKAIIYQPTIDPILNRRYNVRISFEDLKKLHLPECLRVAVGSEGKTALKPVAEVWLQHRNRHQYLGGVIFDPSGRHARADISICGKGSTSRQSPEHGRS